ncbi:hypothetical protein C8A00DRAFT_17549 [Chaetomidium leptoderma]|uniref:Uncharacterized protein n=1 Tax=Chaetomidium leptoderma TaxID=669021 RepID=A0AAN6VI86_9PEZI|nr:hypothetical protein C8A00DRAFT_17549 [Chaetomidium leptoderma]
MAPFPSPTTAPFLWHRPVCDCHFYYQYYLCGCPDRTAPMDAGHSCHVPCFQGCPMRYKPLWEQEMHHGYGFQHNPNPPTSSDPSVLPFPCYRHAVESCILLPPSALRNTRNRLMDPQWNPFSIQRKNRNMHMLQRFKDQGRSWEGKKRVREEEGDESSRRPPRKRRSKPETLELAHSSSSSRNHFATLDWLLEEQSIDLWAQDGYRSRCPPPLAPREQQQQESGDGMVRDVVFDGNTHRGYHGGAYKLDHDVLHQARVANWSWLGDREGKLARAVGEWFRAGGGWWGRGLSME